MSNNSTSDLNVNNNSNQLTDADTRTEADKSVHTIPFTMIPNELIDHTTLSPDACFLLIFLLRHIEGWIFNDPYILKRMQCGQRKLEKLFKELRTAGYVKNIKVAGAHGQKLGTKRLFARLPKYLNEEKPEPALLRGSEKPRLGKAQDINNTKTNNKTKLINKTDNEGVSNLSKTKKPVQQAEPTPSNIEKVFKHWQIVMRHPQAKLDASRKRNIAKGLKAYSLEECLLAIDGNARSPLHNGTEDGKIFDSLELIFRNADKTEGFIRNAHHAPIIKPKSNDWMKSRAEGRKRGDQRMQEGFRRQNAAYFNNEKELENDNEK